MSFQKRVPKKITNTLYTTYKQKLSFVYCDKKTIIGSEGEVEKVTALYILTE